MPILDPDDQRFRGAKSEGFESSLPDSDLLARAEVSQAWAEILADDWHRTHTSNYTAIATNLLVRLTTKYGVPPYRFPALESVFDISHDLRGNYATVSWDRVAKGHVVGPLRTLDRSLKRLLTAIQPMRSVVRIGVSTHQTGVDLRKYLDQRVEQQQVLPKTAFAYKKGPDSDLTNSLLVAAQGSPDWTSLFSPVFSRLARTSQGKMHWEHKSVAWHDANVEEGTEIAFTGAERIGRGVMPGFTRIPMDVINVRGTSEDPREFSSKHVVENTDLVPSARQAGLTLWQAVMKNGPHAWRIDPDKIVEAWHEYFDGLNLFVDAAGASRSDVPVRLVWGVDHVANWAVVDGRGRRASRVPGLDADDVPERYVQEIGGRCSWAQLVEWQVRGVWERRLRPMLGTLTCAYVGESFAGIRWAKTSRPELYRRWLEMRRLLLTHSARRLVDLDLVPDREYRQALEGARRQASVNLAPRPDDSSAPGTGIEPLDRLQGSLPQGPYGGGARLEPGETAWDDEPAIVPPEANLPDPEDLPLPPLREQEESPWGRVAVAGLGAALLFAVR